MLDGYFARVRWKCHPSAELCAPPFTHSSLAAAVRSQGSGAHNRGPASSPWSRAQSFFVEMSGPITICLDSDDDSDVTQPPPPLTKREGKKRACSTAVSIDLTDDADLPPPRPSGHIVVDLCDDAPIGPERRPGPMGTAPPKPRGRDNFQDDDDVADLTGDQLSRKL